MSPLRRRTLLGATVTGGALLAGAPLIGARAHAEPATPRWLGAGPMRHVYDPSPDDGPRRYLNDHCTIRDADGTWHLFSIIGDTAPPGEAPDSAVEDDIAHATAPDLKGPWTTQEPALSTDPDYFGEDHLWAPHVIAHDGTYFMFYSAGSADENEGWAINLATSTDLFEWTRVESGPLFRNGGAARDPMVLRVGDEWVMYYTEVDDQRRHIVAARTSPDLYTWSEARSVYTDEITEDTVSVTESPFVVERDDWYYLFIGTRNGYVGTDVFASRDPLAFQLEDYAGHVPAHCAEVVADGDDWWITAAGWFQRGLHLAPLHWRDAPPLWHSPRNPTVASDLTGEPRLFALAEDYSTLLTRTPSRDWSELGDGFATVPTVAAHADGRLSLFALRPDASLAMCTQDGDGSFGDWREFGGPFDSAPAAVLDGTGRLELFALDDAGSGIVHCLQKQADEDEWTDWKSFGGSAGAPPAVVANANGGVEIVALGPGGTYLAHRRRDAEGDWGEWDTSFGTPAGSAPTLARGVGDRLHATVIAPMGLALFHRTQTDDGWGEWREFSSWNDNGAATMVAGADGRLEAFFMPPAGEVLYHRVQGDDGEWSDRAEFGTGPIATTPAACLDGDGVMHVFAVTDDGVVRWRAQTEPGGDWGDWSDLDGAAIAVVPAGSAS